MAFRKKFKKRRGSSLKRPKNIYRNRIGRRY